MNSKTFRIILTCVSYLLIVSVAYSQNKTGYIKYLQVKYNGLDTLSSGMMSKYSLFYKGEEVSYLDMQERTRIASKEEQSGMVLNMSDGVKLLPQTYSYQNMTAKVLIYNEHFAPGVKLSVKDSMTLISWKLSKKTKKIQNIECFSAQAEYRGRVWNAWYAPSIPISSGPWLLYGLPGIILEAEDLNKTVQFICESVVTPSNDVKIDKPEFLGVKNEVANSKDLPKEVKERSDNRLKMMQSRDNDKGIKITGMAFYMNTIEIFDFEKNMELKRFQQKLSDIPKK